MPNAELALNILLFYVKNPQSKDSSPAENYFDRFALSLLLLQAHMASDTKEYDVENK